MNGLVSFRLCKLSTPELLEKVDKLTDEMYQKQELPARHIPARPDSDYDLLVGELVLRMKEHDDFINEIDQDLSDLGLFLTSYEVKEKISEYLARPYGTPPPA